MLFADGAAERAVGGGGRRRICRADGRHGGGGGSSSGGGRRLRAGRAVAAGRASVEAGRGEVPAQLHAREAALLVHLTDHDGHPVVASQNVHAVGDLPVHHGPVPLLPAEPAALAELDPVRAQ